MRSAKKTCRGDFDIFSMTIPRMSSVLRPFSLNSPRRWYSSTDSGEICCRTSGMSRICVTEEFYGTEGSIERAFARSGDPELGVSAAGCSQLTLSRCLHPSNKGPSRYVYASRGDDRMESRCCHTGLNR